MISRYRFEFVVCLILALVVAAIYGQTMNHEFINFDDDVYIYENPYIKDGLTEENIKWAFTDAYAFIKKGAQVGQSIKLLKLRRKLILLYVR